MSVSPLTGKPFSYSNRDMRSNNPRTANRKRFNACMALSARFAEIGFPIRTPFTSIDDIKAYLGGERILCLQCGKPYKALNGHLRVHGMTSESYKKYYDLPWRSGLNCVETKGLQSANGKRIFAEGGALGSQTQEERAAARAKARVTKHRPVTLAHREAAKRNILAMNGNVQWRDADYHRILDMMRERDMTPAEVMALGNLPSFTQFSERRRANPEYRAAYDAVVAGLSDATKRRLKANWGAEERVADLRRSGLTVEQAAEKLGVSYQTVINHSTAYVKPPLRTTCSKGHPLNEHRRCSICDLEATRKLRGYLPRAEAAKTMVPDNCIACGVPILRSRIGNSGKKLCAACKKERQRAAVRASDAKRRERNRSST